MITCKIDMYFSTRWRKFLQFMHNTRCFCAAIKKESFRKLNILRTWKPKKQCIIFVVLPHQWNFYPEPCSESNATEAVSSSNTGCLGKLLETLGMLGSKAYYTHWTEWRNLRCYFSPATGVSSTTQSNSYLLRVALLSIKCSEFKQSVIFWSSPLAVLSKHAS